MNTIGSRFCDDVDDRPASPAVLSVEIRRLNVGLRNEVGQCDLKSLTCDRDVVVFSTIDLEIVGAAARSIYHKGFVPETLRVRGYTGQGKRKQGWIAARER